MNDAERVRSLTRLGAVPLVPEVMLHLLMPDHPLWAGTPADAEALGVPMPYWAFAWPGGQALARWILDHPSLVRGRRVLDLGCGGAIEAIAAAKAGAAQVRCVDLDPYAVCAARLNAMANDVSLVAAVGDALELDVGEAEVVLVGDLSFEPGITRTLEAWIARHPVEVVMGDAGRVPLSGEYEVLGRLQAPFDGDPRGSVPWTVTILRR